MEFIEYTRFEELYDEALAAGLWEPSKRRLLFFRLEKILPGVPLQVNPQGQLRQDLVILNQLAPRNGVPPLVTWVENARPEVAGTDQQPFFEKLLQDLRGESASTAIPAAKQRVVPESILWQDDMLPVSYLQRGMRCSAAVARLKVHQYRDGVGTGLHFWGTGWMLTQDVLITAHHVFNARSDGEAAASPGDLDLQVRHTDVQLDVDAENGGVDAPGISEMLHCDPQLDYAVFKLSSPLTRQPLTVNWSPFSLKADEVVPLNIIQHPAGQAKKIAIRNNLATQAQSPEIRYFTSTLGGSSGAPVFNDSWQVVGLHRASIGTTIKNFQGKQTAIINLGTQMAAIRQSMPLAVQALLV